VTDFNIYKMNFIDLSALTGLVVNENPALESETISENAENIVAFAKQKNLRIWLERQKGGRVSTLIRGFENVTDMQLTDLAKTLKTKMATGGAAKNNEITLQGDVRTKTLETLTALGHTAKKAGG
jgi:translation initiation factor 1